MNIIARNILIALKFLIPLCFLWFPFSAVWANFLLDSADGDLLMGLGLNEYTYQTIDKIADFWSYIFMLVLGLRWKIKKTIIFLFIYRAIGQVLFLTTRNELFFFYFQNFLEPLILIYVTLIAYKKSETKAYDVYVKQRKVIWAGILIYKIWNEWYLHFANIDLSTMFLGINGGSK